MIQRNARKFTLIFSILLMMGACSSQPTDNVVPTETPIPTASAAGRPTFTVQRGDVQQVLEMRGRWLPRDQETLTFQLGGSISRINVRQGDAARQGDVLVTLQTQDLEDQLIDAEFALQTAQRNFESGGAENALSLTDAYINLANSNLSIQSAQASLPWAAVEQARLAVEQARHQLQENERQYHELMGQYDAPASAVDSAYQAWLNAQEALRNAEIGYSSASASYYSAQLSLQQLENTAMQQRLDVQAMVENGGNPNLIQAVEEASANVAILRRDIELSTVRAPFDGVVFEIFIETGETVEAFHPIITIARLEPKEVVVNLPFSDIEQFQVGQMGICRIDSQREVAAACQIRRVPLTVNEVDQTVRISAGFTNLEIGQIINVEIVREIRTNVLWLPPEAVQVFRDRMFVVLETPNGQQVINVEIGLQSPERVEIVSGLSVGDVVSVP